MLLDGSMVTVMSPLLQMALWTDASAHLPRASVASVTASPGPPVGPGAWLAALGFVDAILCQFQRESDLFVFCLVNFNFLLFWFVLFVVVVVFESC